MRYLYSIILYLLTPVVLLRLIRRGFSDRDYWSRWHERFGTVQLPASSRPLIWLHAVSVGEVQAALPLVQRLQSDYPHYQLLMTTVTPTGSAMVRQKCGSGVLHCYFPYDLPHVVNRFLNRVKPVVLIVLETEIWPNLYSQCQARGIKLILANARLSQKSFDGYRKIAGLTRQVLGNVDMIAAQSDDDAQRLAALGADRSRMTVTGNLKFDVRVADDVIERGRAIKRELGPERLLWIAASTHEGEEPIVLAAHRKVIENFPDCLLVLAPRHPERAAGVRELCLRQGFTAQRVSDVRAGGRDRAPAEVQVLVLDTIGELLDYYAAADVALVGGSLLPAYGGHNVLEPAVLGVPVVTGEFTANFKEINRLLLEMQAEFRVADSDQLEQRVSQLLADDSLRRQMGQAGASLVRQNQGSTGRIMEMLFKFLHQENNQRVTGVGGLVT